MRFLGIDYGTKRIGISISDDLGKMAFPKEVIQNSKELILQIIGICKEENIETVIIGESKNLNGEPNPLMKKIEIFIKEWERETNIPIFLEPEFLTSHQAQKIQGKNDMIDASAATIILQSYLDKLSYKNINKVKQKEMEKINFDDFKKVDMRIGTIKSAEKIPDTDKLLRLEVEFAEGEVRQIVSGIAEYYPNPEDLVGKQSPFVYNLEPRTIRGYESNGMILGVGGEEVGFAALSPSKDVPPGSSLR